MTSVFEGLKLSSTSGRAIRESLKEVIFKVRPDDGEGLTMWGGGIPRMGTA